MHYTHGRAENLLASPIEAGIRSTGDKGGYFSAQRNSSPKVTLSKNGKAPVATVECPLLDDSGRDSGVQLRTRYEYRWGYIKIRREFVFEKPMDVGMVDIFTTTLDPSLEQFGYRQGMGEQEGHNTFDFGVVQWRKLRPGAFFDPSLDTRFVPRYIVFANSGVEGIEWFVSDDLSQWDYQITGKPGYGCCSVSSRNNPLGIEVRIHPLDIPGSVSVKGTLTFDCYIGMPILEGHANKPWLHTSFNRNKGDWVSPAEIKQWADSGIRTVHCHNDGDYYGDNLFWHDGTYPPYPPDDMKKYDAVIEECHKNGIRIATYFSNKELHLVTDAYKQHGEEWGRKPGDTGELQHNTFNKNEFGAQMCLKSGWLGQLETNIDTVLKNHKLDGVYYDWNVGLYCNNSLHMGKTDNGVKGTTKSLALSPTGHWDIDELLQLMEWTRERVGPNGLVIVHDTMTPMFATENFADYVVGMEWGYGLLSRSVPPVQELPLEWQFAGARSRGVIGYGTIAENAPKRLHKVEALETLLTGVAPWPVSPEAIELYKILKPLGDITQYQFEDWRNTAVKLDDPACISAVYSREGESWILIGNPTPEPKQVTCRISAKDLPVPLATVGSTGLMGDKPAPLSATKLAGAGERITIPGDGAVMVRVAK